MIILLCVLSRESVSILAAISRTKWCLWGAAAVPGHVLAGAVGFATDTGPGWEAFAVISGMLSILLAILWGVRRKTGLGVIEGNAEIHILARLSVSPRTRVYVIKIADERYLLAESPAGVALTPLQQETALDDPS